MDGPEDDEQAVATAMATASTVADRVEVIGRTPTLLDREHGCPVAGARERRGTSHLARTRPHLAFPHVLSLRCHPRCFEREDSTRLRRPHRCRSPWWWPCRSPASLVTLRRRAVPLPPRRRAPPRPLSRRRRRSPRPRCLRSRTIRPRVRVRPPDTRRTAGLRRAGVTPRLLPGACLPDFRRRFRASHPPFPRRCLRASRRRCPQDFRPRCPPASRPPCRRAFPLRFRAHGRPPCRRPLRHRANVN